MVFDQRIEPTLDGYFRPSNFNFPEALLRFKKDSGNDANNVYELEETCWLGVSWCGQCVCDQGDF